MTKYLFAWSEYVGASITPTYYAVDAGGNIFTSVDWNYFFSITGQYCDKKKHLFIDGYLTSNEEVDIYTHSYAKAPFVIENNKVRYLRGNKITRYPYEYDAEAVHWNSVTAWMERDR